MTLQEYLQEFYTARTAASYEREIVIYLSHRPEAAQAGYKAITDYIGVLRERYHKTATISRIVSSIKVYYDYLCHEGQREDHPAKSIRLRDKRNRDIQLQDLLTPEELATLLHRKERFPKLIARNKVLMSLLIYQGLRPAEMAAVTVPDIDLATGSLYIKVLPKTNPRTLQLKPNQVLLFYQYIHEIRPELLLKAKGPPPAALLVGTRGAAMTAEDITKHVKRSCKGLYAHRQVNAQTIRQSLIANLLKQGHDLSVVQGFAGHKYPSTTERYQQTDLETLKAAVEKYHPFG